MMMARMFHSVRDNRGALAVTAVGVAVAGSTALMALYWIQRKQTATRRASLKCSCGKVVVDFYQPAANYKYAEPPNLQCACRDCTSYCKAVLKEGSTSESFQQGFFDPGVPTLLFYDSEIVVTKGKEQLESMKLSEKTENRRVFAKCCGTPIAIAPDHSHLNLIYSNIIEPTKEGDCQDNEVPYPSQIINECTILLHAENLERKLSENSKHPNMKIIPTVVAPIEILKIVGRLFLLLGIGEQGPGEGFPMDSGKTLWYGIESIPKKMK